MTALASDHVNQFNIRTFCHWFIHLQTDQGLQSQQYPLLYYSTRKVSIKSKFVESAENHARYSQETYFFVVVKSSLEVF